MLGAADTTLADAVESSSLDLGLDLLVEWDRSIAF